MLKTSLETASSVFAFPPNWIPKPITFENFVNVWNSLGVYKYVVNSVIITTAGVFLSVALAALFAYPLARWQFPGRNLLFFLVLLPMMVPVQGGFIINFLTARNLGLVNYVLGRHFTPSGDAVRRLLAAPGVYGHSAGLRRRGPHRRRRGVLHLVPRHAAAN